MATIHRSAGLTLRDQRGYTARVHWTQAYDSAAQAGAVVAAETLATQIVALTTGALASTSGLASQGVRPLTYGAGGLYYSVADKAEMFWRTSSGSVAVQRIPAPLRALFLADGSTINPANLEIALYEAAVLAAAVTNQGGDLLITFVGGKLATRPARRRIATTVREPGLTSSDW